MWDPGQRRLHRLCPVLRALRRQTDPLFRHGHVDLDAAQ